EPERGSPMSTPTVRHFLLSLGMEYDQTDPYARYCPRNLLFRYRPPDASGYPFLMPDLWLFVLVVGAGYHELWMEVDYAGSEPDDDRDPELVAAYGPFVIRLGADETRLPRSWHLRAVPFDRPGWYTFRLLCEGVTLAEELIELED